MITKKMRVESWEDVNSITTELSNQIDALRWAFGDVVNAYTLGELEGTPEGMQTIKDLASHCGQSAKSLSEWGGMSKFWDYDTRQEIAAMPHEIKYTHMRIARSRSSATKEKNRVRALELIALAVKNEWTVGQMAKFTKPKSVEAELEEIVTALAISGEWSDLTGSHTYEASLPPCSDIFIELNGEFGWHQVIVNNERVYGNGGTTYIKGDWEKIVRLAVKLIKEEV